MSLQLQTIQIEPDITVVRLIGNVIAGSEGHDLEQLLRKLLASGQRKLILDLCGIEEISSAGAQFLIQCFFTIRQAEGELRLASANPKIADLLSAARLDTLIPFYRTVAAASQDFELKKRT